MSDTDKPGRVFSAIRPVFEGAGTSPGEWLGFELVEGGLPELVPVIRVDGPASRGGTPEQFHKLENGAALVPWQHASRPRLHPRPP